MNVVIDTNWLISYLMKQETSQLKLILQDIDIRLFTDEEQIKEFTKIVYLPKFRNYFPLEPALEFLRYFTNRCNIVSVVSNIEICRDPKDNFLLAISKDADADYLLTGDKDLLILEKFEQTIICTLSHFIEHYLPK
ncbi:MAG: putative toxin-antitoxin system toxin component, PIN family [Chitinophagaceae bacterium]|jgi:uncharacterized protein|nr:putative toxin-antitoxin system toxin component, PIN family [Chitinophagaceae bacterium]